MEGCQWRRKKMALAVIKFQALATTARQANRWPQLAPRGYLFWLLRLYCLVSTFSKGVAHGGSTGWLFSKSANHRGKNKTFLFSKPSITVSSSCRVRCSQLIVYLLPMREKTVRFRVGCTWPSRCFLILRGTHDSEWFSVLHPRAHRIDVMTTSATRCYCCTVALQSQLWFYLNISFTRVLPWSTVFHPGCSNLTFSWCASITG